MCKIILVDPRSKLQSGQMHQGTVGRLHGSLNTIRLK